MRFPPSLLDEIRARLPVSQVVARKVALKRAGPRVQGPVALQAGEDALLHRQRPEGLLSLLRLRRARRHLHLRDARPRACPSPRPSSGWPQEAGVPMPEGRPARRRRPRTSATRLYALVGGRRRVLRGAAGRRRRAGGAALSRQARAQPRRPSPASAWAMPPTASSALKEHLAKAGFTTAEMIASGMLIAGDDIPVAYDRFRHRIMFPDHRPQGPRDRLRRARARSRCAGQIPELAGDAALPQGRRAVQRPQRARPPPTTRARSSSSKATWT